MTRSGRSWLAAAGAAVLAIALLLPGLGAAPFDDPGEGQQAEIAREISTGGHWLTLRLNGVRYFDKPPLLYWLAAGSFALFDPGEWSARLVPLLGAVLAAAGTALLGARLLGLGGGLVGAGALLSSALFVAFSRYVRPETLFVAAIQWGFTGLLLGAGSTAGNPRSRRWLLLGCLGLGIASIAKDPLGLVGPLAAVGLALALAGRARPLSTWLPWEGAAVLLVVGFGWYAIAAAREPGFLWYSVVDNHLLNAARLRRFPDEDVPLSALEFIAVSGAGCFPWIIAAGAAVASMARRRAWRDPSEAPWIALALWAVGLVAFFILVPFRLPHYALPIYPAVALLAARGWWSASSRARPLIAAHACAFVVLGAGFALAAASDGARFIDVVFSATDVYTRKQAVLGESGPTLPWSSLQPLVARGAVTFAVTGAALILALVRSTRWIALCVVLAGMLATMPLVERGLAMVAARRAVAAMGAEIDHRMRGGDLLVHEGPIENSGALEFYSGRRPVLLDGRRSVLGIGATFPDAAGAFWEGERFRRAWLSDRRVLLITPRPLSTSVTGSLPPERVRLLMSDNGRRLYDNARP